MWSTLLLACLLITSFHYTRSVPVPSGLAAIQKYLLPRDPRVPVLLKLLDRVTSLASPILVVSTGDPTHAIDKILQYFVASLDNQEAKMVTGGLEGNNGVRYQRVEYIHGDVLSN